MSVISGRPGGMQQREKIVYPAFTPPQCDVGTPILFYPNCDTSAKPWLGSIAYVNRQANTQELCPELGVNVVDHDGNPFQRHSVRHKNDPRCKDPRVKGNGCWDFQPEPPHVTALRARLDQQEARIGDLEKRLMELETRPAKSGKAS